MKNIPYGYYNAPIPGGGYVTGFAFDYKEPGVLYCRTDIGGSYRYSYKEDRWHCLTFHVGMEDLSETFPIAIAAADKKLYIACGDGRRQHNDPQYHCGRLCISDDGGESFSYEDIPCYIHGNLSGRGSGKRLVPAASGRLFFASQCNGLGVRETDGKWRFTDICGEAYLTFVHVSDDEKTLIIGTAGISNRQGDHRGHSLYISRDGGSCFEELAEPYDDSDRLYAGYVAKRYAVDDKYIYVTFCISDPNGYAGWMGYSCDGGMVQGGKVVRYPLQDLSGGYEDITPENAVNGFGGIAATPAMPGLLAVSSLCRYGGDIIWISYDRGDHWERALHDMDIGNMHFNASYLGADKHGGHSPVHWMSDLAISPFDADELWFNTGTGVFKADAFTKKDRSFSDHCDGIEETVHLNLYSPPSGDVQLIDIVGDLGGFAFRDLKKACDNSFADDNGFRYITCINADFPDNDPSTIVVAARGNWTGQTKGGIIISRDGAKSWERLALPYGIDERIDRLCNRIEHPNTNPGWVSISADGSSVVYTLAENVDLWVDNAICGVMPVKVTYLSDDGSRHKLKIFSDRVDPMYFYGFGENSRLYISKDRGCSFKELDSPLPEGTDFGLIDCINKTEIRGSAGFFGTFYIAMESKGLWKLEYDKESDSFSARRLTNEGDTVYRCGLGIKTETYSGAEKMIYISGIIDGKYGFYRSEDEGYSWDKLNDEKHLFGEVNSMEGDCRKRGRFFIGSGSMGVIVGEEDL